MRGFPTTYTSLFETSDGDRPTITGIEIPIIQRDYAQGRRDSETTVIRRDFLSVLIRALTTAESVALDFVYGEVENGTLKPLDGQQRLTTLFLLHWYVGSRAGTVDSEQSWTHFRYTTRLSAEYFCRELVANPWTHDDGVPVDWITDQSWYLFPWRTDPTIQAMLVMIASIHERLSEEAHDFRAIWERLASPDSEAISFLFLPIEDMESGDDLYIKMNSRGKPLTEFEVFKARLEKVLEPTDRHKELTEKFDRQWSDLLWHYDDGDCSIDTEFMHYLAFIIDVCEWRRGSTRSTGSLLERAERLFVGSDESSESDRAFLFFAFDTWVSGEPRDDVPDRLLGELFSVAGSANAGLRLFESQHANLFGACLRGYGSNQFSLAETLLLFGVLVFRQACTDEPMEVLVKRLRSLRNLAESAPNQVQSAYMPELVEATTRLMRDGELDGLKRFSQTWIDDEKEKWNLLHRHPELTTSVHALEDHPLLRGRLLAFELDPSSIERHSGAFRKATAGDALETFASALLAKGDYSRAVSSAKRQFGVRGQRSDGGSWRDVLTLGTRETNGRLRTALGTLLDDVAGSDAPASKSLRRVADRWLLTQESERTFNWRCYFVRYWSMLDSPRGNYVGDFGSTEGPANYDIDMLHGGDYRSSFTDPYLLAIWTESGRPGGLHKPDFRSWDYTGNEQAMILAESGLGVRNIDVGFEIVLPEESVQAEAATALLAPFGLESDGRLRVSQDDRGIDTEDRVQKGVQIVRALLDHGL